MRNDMLTSGHVDWPELSHRITPDCRRTERCGLAVSPGERGMHLTWWSRKPEVNWNKDARLQWQTKPHSSCVTGFIFFQRQSEPSCFFTLATTRLSWRTLQCVLLCIIFFFWLNILVHYLFPPFSDFFVHLGKTGLLKSRYFWAPTFKMSLKLGSESGCLPRILQGFVLGSSRVYFNELTGRAFALLCVWEDRGEIKEEGDVCPGA